MTINLTGITSVLGHANERYEVTTAKTRSGLALLSAALDK